MVRKLLNKFFYSTKFALALLLVLGLYPGLVQAQLTSESITTGTVTSLEIEYYPIKEQYVVADTATGRSLASTHFDFNGVLLAQALEEIASRTSVNLIHDPKLTGATFVYKRIRGSSVSEILSALLSNTGLDFIILSSGTYVIVSSSAALPSFGSITGKIHDAITGEPLPGATIMLADASAGTATNLQGLFNINKLISGRHEIIISFVGYEPVRLPIEIPENRDVYRTVGLYPQSIHFSPVVVSAHRPILTAVSHTESGAPAAGWSKGGAQSFNTLQSLSLFSGVQHGIPLTDTHIQGGSRGEHRLYLDGIPVYNPYSFGQLFSAFSPYAIRRVDVEKAGFDARSGSHISGMVNLTHHVNRPDEVARVQIDPMSTNITGSSSVDIAENRRFQLMAAYRTSLWGVYEDPALSSTLGSWEIVDPLIYNLIIQDQSKNDGVFVPAVNRSDIQFSDLHLAANLETGRYSRLYFSFYSGGNEVETNVLTRDDLAKESDERIFMFSSDRYDWRNQAGQIRFDWLATPRLDLNFQLGYTSSNMRHSYTMFDDARVRAFSNPESEERIIFNDVVSNLGHGIHQLDDNRITQYIGRADASYAISPGMKISGGLQADYIESSFNLSDLFYLPAVDNQNSAIISSYLHSDLFARGPFQIGMGSRFTLLTNTGNVYAEPRLSMQYDFRTRDAGFYSARVSGGLYRQFINQFDITNAGPSSIVPNFTIWAHDSGIKQPKAWHTAFSFVAEPASGTSIRAETWLKFQPVMYSTSYERLLFRGDGLQGEGFESFAETTKGESYGLSLRLNQSLIGNSLEFMAGYDWSVSRILMSEQFGRWMSAPWNHPHTFQARLLSRPFSGFTTYAKWMLVEGRTWAFRQSYYDFLLLHNVHGAGSFDFTNPEEDKLPSYIQLDIGFAYERNLGFGSIEARLDLNNVLNRQNVMDVTLFPEIATGGDISSANWRTRNRVLPGFSPAVSLSLFF
ncbi:MAG: TonB-dependent receptor [Balneolales bacterium]|nr:TonB-dependent receptor [Balneolales bacterium]